MSFIIEVDSLCELSKKIKSNPKAVWKILAGGTTSDQNLAQELEKMTGISAQVLMFNKTSKARSSVLIWVAKHLGLSKNHIYRILHQRCPPGRLAVNELVKFSGIKEQFWTDPEKKKLNWMFLK